MSELTAAADVVGRRPVEDLAASVAGVALFEGLDVTSFAGAFKRIDLAAGEVLWQQGTPTDGLYVLTAGEVQVCRRLPGQRELELTRLARGDVMGEIPLLGGGTRSATVRALVPCSLLFLSRAEFEAHTTAGAPGALALRRRIVAIACARLRRVHADLAARLAGAAVGRDHERVRDGTARANRHPQALPPRAYLARLPLLRGLERDLVAELLDRATAPHVPRGHVVEHEGEPPSACHVVLNGAVEEVVRRGTASLRVGFAGPGHAFSCVGLVDGGPASASSVTRERCLFLAIDPEHFASLYRSESVRSRAFAEAIEADLISSLRTAERTLAHLGAATAT